MKILSSIIISLITTSFAGTSFATNNLRLRCFRDHCEINNANTKNDQEQLKFSSHPKDFLNKTENVVFINSSLHTFPDTLITELPNLKRITAHKCDIQSISPRVFGTQNLNNLKQLRALLLANNKLSTLANRQFEGAKYLQELDLSKNQISKIGASAFLGLDALTQLNLEQNQLKSLEPGIFNTLPELWHVNLNSNQLRSLDFGVFHYNHKLDIIRVANNEINQLLPSDRNLSASRLDINNNNLSDISAISKAKKLKVLNLSNNSDLKLNPTIFSQFYNLSTLMLDGVASLKSLNWHYALYLSLNNLQTLSIANNKLEKLAFKNFSNLPLLEYLYIDRNGLKELDYVLIPQKFPKLKAISLYGNKWNCSFFNKMQEKLSSWKLVELDVDSFEKTPSLNKQSCVDQEVIKGDDSGGTETCKSTVYEEKLDAIEKTSKNNGFWMMTNLTGIADALQQISKKIDLAMEDLQQRLKSLENKIERNNTSCVATHSVANRNKG